MRGPVRATAATSMRCGLDRASSIERILRLPDALNADADRTATRYRNA